MKERDYLEEYLLLCQRIYERKVLDGTWPWPEDSPNSHIVLDSGDNIENL